MSRVYGERKPLDYLKVKKFFDDRSAKIEETGRLSVTMYQSEEVAQLRDAHEKTVILPLLQAGPSTRALDIGCGTGRWGMSLSDIVGSYLGVDFCQAYIDAGQAMFASKHLDPAKFVFQRLPANEVSAETLAFSPPFDLVIIAGLLAFLNDDDVYSIFRALPDIMSDDATIYLREPLATDQRLTLLDFPSDQLAQDYNVIYRTDEEMQALFAPLVGAGAELISNFSLYPPDMLSPATRSETSQRAYIFRRLRRRES